MAAGNPPWSVTEAKIGTGIQERKEEKVKTFYMKKNNTQKDIKYAKCSTPVQTSSIQNINVQCANLTKLFHMR